MLNAIRGAISALATAGIVVLAASYFGDTHPMFDSFAAFRLHILIGFVALIFFSVAFAALVARAIGLFGLMLAAAGIARALIPGDPVVGAAQVVYSHNLHWDNPRPDQVIETIERESPDIVLLQEMSPDNIRMAQRLRYRTEVYCTEPDETRPAILSRHPIIGEPGCDDGLAWARLDTPIGALTVVSVHLDRPWPYEQPQHAAAMAAILADLPEPILIAGDFNNAAWSYAATRIAEATGSRPVRGLRLTFQRPAFWPGLPLDHVFISEDLVAETTMLDAIGSDHHALLTRVQAR